MSARTVGHCQSKQSDDDFQRHNANRRHREGSGQDRFGQQAGRDNDGALLYTVERLLGGRYYRLQSVASNGPGDGRLVLVRQVRRVNKKTDRGEELFRLV